jgi:LEA14-like dessication related protein
LRSIEDVRVRSKGGDQLELYAKLVFFNPNEVKFKFRSYHIEIFLDGNKITEINDNVKRTILPETEFEMNTVAEFSLGDIEGNIISSALGFLSNKSKIRFVGNIKLSRNGINFTIPVNQEKQIKL